MALHPDALALIIDFEGYLRQIGGGRVAPYLCPARVPTIGYGTTRYPDGRRVAMSDEPIDRDTATRYLASEIREDEVALDRLNTATLSPRMRGALVSFVYNCGAGAYRGSLLRRAVNAGRWRDVPRELAKWRMGGGRILAGLVRRRAAEGALFVRGVADLSSVDSTTDLPAREPPRTPVVNAPRGLWGAFWQWFLR